MKSKQYLASEHFWAKKLPTGWRYEFFNDLISDTIDNRGRTVPTSDHGIPLIATNCISNDSLYPKFKDIRYVSQKTHDEWFRDGHPEPNDIIFVNKGSPGQVCLVPSPLNFCFAQDMIGLKIDYKKVDFRYLLAVLRTKFMQEQIFAFHVGTLIPHLKKADLNSIIIPIPPKKLEEFIGEYYLTVSSKIENLQNQNKVLEKIIQSIFKSWFVDFDGVTEFEDSELGKIPKGWKVKQIKDYCKVRRGASPRPVGDPRYFGGDIPWIKIADVTGLTSPYLFSTKETVTKEGAKKSVHLPEDSLIVSNSGTVGKPIFLTRDGCIHDGWLYFEDLKEISQEFLYFLLLKLSILLNHLGDGTVQKNLNTTIMGEQQFICPPKSYLDSFLKLSQIFLKSMKENQIKINTLTKIRDSLLPKLMSGEIRV